MFYKILKFLVDKTSNLEPFSILLVLLFFLQLLENNTTLFIFDHFGFMLSIYDWFFDFLRSFITLLNQKRYFEY